VRHERNRSRRIAARFLCAIVLLSVPCGARGEDTVASASAKNDVAVVLRRSPTAAPRATLFVETTSDESLETFALARGMHVLRIYRSQLMPEAAQRNVLGQLIARYRRETGANRVIAHGVAGTMAALFSGGFDGVLLEGADSVATPATARVITVAGADFFWSVVPPALNKEAASANLRRFYLSGIALAGKADCAPPTRAAAAPALRALLVALEDWTKGVKPPVSRFPGATDLVPARALVWQKIPRLPTPPSDARFVPPIDADGNERPVGLVLPDHALPIATFTAFGADRAVCGGGMTLPFAASKAEREKNADPRPSLVERYGSRAYFVATMRVIADRLVKERLLLQEDADAYVAAAKAAPF
jgi:hypothetical protein